MHLLPPLGEEARARHMHAMCVILRRKAYSRKARFRTRVRVSRFDCGSGERPDREVPSRSSRRFQSTIRLVKFRPGMDELRCRRLEGIPLRCPLSSVPSLDHRGSRTCTACGECTGCLRGRRRCGLLIDRSVFVWALAIPQEVYRAATGMAKLASRAAGHIEVRSASGRHRGMQDIVGGSRRNWVWTSTTATHQVRCVAEYRQARFVNGFGMDSRACGCHLHCHRGRCGSGRVSTWQASREWAATCSESDPHPVPLAQAGWHGLPCSESGVILCGESVGLVACSGLLAAVSGACGVFPRLAQRRRQASSFRIGSRAQGYGGRGTHYLC